MGNKIHKVKYHEGLINKLKLKGFDLQKLDVSDYLGGGSSFDAYLLNKTKVAVAKISNSESANSDYYKMFMRNMEKTIDKPFRNVAKTFHVFSSPQDNIHIITQEYVPFSTNYVYLFNEEQLGIDILYYLTDMYFNDGFDLPKDIDKLIDKIKSQGGIFDVHPQDDIPISTFQEIKDFLLQVLNGLKELESIGINAKDVHSENVRVTKNGVYKIIDF